MAKRKDPRGITLRKGEYYRKDKQIYRFDYKDVFGKKASVYASDLMALREKEKEINHDKYDGIDTYAAKTASLNYLFDRYMRTKTNLKVTTKSNYKYMYDHYVRETFGRRRIAEIKFSDVMDFYLTLMERDGLKINTLDTIQTLLHPAFQMAVRDDIIRKNPSDGIIGQISKDTGKNKGVRHALTKEQQKSFMSYISKHETYNHWTPLFTILLGTGGRIGEILGLRWEDVDLENRLISINHSVVYRAIEGAKTKKSVLMVSTPKTESGTRIIPMMNSVYEAFLKEYEVQKIIGFNQTVIDGMSGFVFQNRDGNLHNPQTVNRTIHRIVDDYNASELLRAERQHRSPVLVPQFSAHVLRHTFCTRLCEVETNLKAIQSIMGHKNIETTMDVYAEATKERNTEAISTFEKNFNFFDIDDDPEVGNKNIS